jgi:complement component 1 Q subcomponent-binding protein
MFARSIAKNIAKRAVGLAAKPAAPMFRYAPAASFSDLKVAGKGSLKSLIRQEIDFETGNAEVDEEYENVKKVIEKSFKIHQEPGKGEVRLTRSHEDQKIEVFFHVQDVDENMDFEEEEGESEQEPSIGVNFRVDITEGDKKLSVAAVGGQELDVRGMRFLPAGVERNDEEVFYGGPDFSDLEEAVQESFLDYLEERKIDGDLAFFVLAHAREKEQKEYVNWLQNFESFVSK